MRISVTVAAAVTALAGTGLVTAPSAEAETRTARVLEFDLDPVTTQSVASDPMQAAASLARTSGGSVLSSDAWFTAFTVQSMGRSIRSSKSPRPCLSGFYELSSSSRSKAAGWTLSHCTRVLPEFRQVTRTTRLPD
ncbi:hypothetical protein [Gordonia neofelifaecis]|nr:hypothetical protein [Gordonia neofelifaecis]